MAYVTLAESAPYVLGVSQTGNGVTLTSGKRYMITSDVTCYVCVGSSNGSNVTSSNGHLVVAGVPWPPQEAGPMRMGSTLGNALCAGTSGGSGSIYVTEVAER